MICRLLGGPSLAPPPDPDLLLRAAELEAKYGRPMDLAQMRALMEWSRGVKPDCGC